jgi:hypothetical protein
MPKEYCVITKQDDIWYVTSCGVRIMVDEEATKKAGIELCFNCENEIRWGKR